MQHKIATLIISISTISFLNSTLAAIPIPSGWYTGGSAGMSRLSRYYNGAGTSINNNSGSRLGWELNAGYKFLPFLAAEAGYTSYADVPIDNSVGSKAATVRARYAYDLVAKGILPLAITGVEIFGKLGIAGIHTEVKDAGLAGAAGISLGSVTKTGGYMGGGGSYFISPSFAVTVQWSRTRGGKNSTGNSDLYSGGIAYFLG